MTGSIATICRAGATAGGSDRAGYSYGHREKPLESGGFSPFGAVAEGRENFLSLAGQWGGALLNDAPRKGFPGTGSGRIAQLVEQLTLNQRVPGSSPGAPTKLFGHLGDGDGCENAHRLQFCSRFELQHGSLSKLNIATDIMRVQNCLNILQ